MKKHHILIVEDEIKQANQLVRCLPEEQYVMSTAESFDEAVSHLIKSEIDLAIIDIDIKGPKNGIALALEINRTYHIPYFFTSIIADHEILSEAETLSNFLPKPFNKRQVQIFVERGLRNNFQYNLQIKDLWAYEYGQNMKEKGVFSYNIKLEDIEWIQTNNMHKKGTIAIYTSLRKNPKTPDFEMRKTLKEIFAHLPSNFAQVSESHIINKDKITAFSKLSESKRGIIKIGEQEITITSSFYKLLDQWTSP